MSLIKKEEYKDFSWDFHHKQGHKPIVAQMELTFSCPLHCRHCYTDGYNHKLAKKSELPSEKVKQILDKCKVANVLWLMFTGGDPLVRKDFGEIYTYARKLGFITTVFSSLTSLDQEILEVFKTWPPFKIETTLNAATAKVYYQITKTHLFEKQIRSIKKLLKNNLAVRVKTQITKQNIQQLEKIKKLVQSFGLKFRPSTLINARLNHDAYPCSLRVRPQEAAQVIKQHGYFEEKCERRDLIQRPKNNKLLNCAAGGHAFWISAQGRMFICSSLREPDYDLLKKGNSVREGFYKLYKKVHGLRFETYSACRGCKYRLICAWCPGRAYLETGNLERPIDYFCNLTKESLKV